MMRRISVVFWAVVVLNHPPAFAQQDGAPACESHANAHHRHASEAVLFWNEQATHSIVGVGAQGPPIGLVELSSRSCTRPSMMPSTPSAASRSRPTQLRPPCSIRPSSTPRWPPPRTTRSRLLRDRHVRGIAVTLRARYNPASAEEQAMNQLT
jgi:hypothetical protein